MERKHRLGLQEETCCKNRQVSEMKSTVLRFMVGARLRAVSYFSLQFKLLHASDKAASRVTWDQALFSFRFVNNSPAGMAKRKESPIQTFYETSAAHFFWLTFAETSNQNYFRCLFFQDANFSRVGKMQTGWLKK